MIYVVGSGPAGVACAYALLAQGLHVTILDAGITLEPEHRRVVDALQSRPLEGWNAELLQALKYNMTSNRKGLPTKLVYGSDFPYRDVDTRLGLEKKHVAPFASLARGGLSNVWGSNVLPYLAHDIADWPITPNDLAPHYEAVLSFMPLAAAKDDLTDIFPLYTDTYHTLRPSQQAAAFLEDLNANRAQLRAHGFIFGTSRLAVQAYPDQHKPGCVYCGLCMYGCPYELIYNSAFTLQTLLAHPNLTYRAGLIVRRVAESHGRVQINAESMETGETIALTGTRVYLACGTLSTTKILLESLGAFHTPLRLLDSQFFLFPLVRYNKVDHVEDERLHTLSQVLIEICDNAISPKTIQTQAYTYNDLYRTALKKQFGPLYPLLKLPVRALLSRLLIVMGYLHSDDSPWLSATLVPGSDNHCSTLLLEATEKATHTKRVIKAVLNKFAQQRSALRAMPVSALLSITEPGKSAHCGGTFPMRTQSTTFATDILGRPSGFDKVHVVDATVFPSIPATSITLAVMANAHRIGSAFGES